METYAIPRMRQIAMKSMPWCLVWLNKNHVDMVSFAIKLIIKIIESFKNA